MSVVTDPVQQSFLDKRADRKCAEKDQHSWVLPPIVDLSFSAMCYVCDVKVTVALIDTLVGP